MPIFCCLLLSGLQYNGYIRGPEHHLQNIQSLYLTYNFITCISILTCLDFKWRLWNISEFFLLVYSLNISWEKNATFNVPIKHKSEQWGEKLTDNCNEISDCIFVHNLRIRHIITLNCCQKNAFAAVTWSLAGWIDKGNKSRTGKNKCFSPESPVMATVGLNISQVEAQRLCDFNQVGEVQADAVEKHRGHDDFIDCPHVFALRRVIWLPPPELNANLPCIFRQLHWNYSGKQNKVVIVSFSCL